MSPKQGTGRNPRKIHKKTRFCFLFAYSNHKIDDNLIMFLNNNKDEANFIAHAGGGINSDTYTNSIEALEKSIQNGQNSASVRASTELYKSLLEEAN